MIGDWLDPCRMSKESLKILQQEGLIFDVTQLVAEAMEERGISKAELAKRLGKSRSFVTQLLDGTANMTLKTVADVFTAMELELSVGSRRTEWSGAKPKNIAAVSSERGDDKRHPRSRTRIPPKKRVAATTARRKKVRIKSS